VTIPLGLYKEFLALIETKIENLQQFDNAVEALQEIKSIAEGFSCTDASETERLHGNSSEHSSQASAVAETPEHEQVPTVINRRRRVKKKISQVSTFEKA